MASKVSDSKKLADVQCVLIDTNQRLADERRKYNNLVKDYAAVKGGNDKLRTDNEALMRTVALLSQELMDAKRRLAIFDPSSYRSDSAPPRHEYEHFTDIG